MLTRILITNAAAIGVMMLTVWIISLPMRNASIVDLVWGLGFALIAWVSASVRLPTATPWSDFPSLWLLPLLTTLWGLRLSGYLTWRNHGRPEDKRYAAMRLPRQESFWWQSLFLIFLLQGVVMWIVSLPLQVGIASAEPGLRSGHLLGIAVWMLGMWFETVGDWQLACFKSRPENRGKVFDQGLWRYTRHPNYFGDFCVWWGFYLIAIAHGTGLWTAIGPAIMSMFLMKYSGVGLLERSLRSEIPGYEDYIRRTSPFFPRPPKPREVAVPDRSSSTSQGV